MGLRSLAGSYMCNCGVEHRVQIASAVLAAFTESADKYALSLLVDAATAAVAGHLAQAK
jgi:hypothetical protein